MDAWGWVQFGAAVSAIGLLVASFVLDRAALSARSLQIAWERFNRARAALLLALLSAATAATLGVEL